jgi:hypothetical protein
VKFEKYFYAKKCVALYVNIICSVPTVTCHLKPSTLD